MDICEKPLETGKMMDLGKRTVLFCGLCGSRMRFVEGRYSFLYRCSRYHTENRACVNRCSLKDKKQIMKYLEEQKAQGRQKAGITGRCGNTLFEVTEWSETLIRITVRRIGLRKERGEQYGRETKRQTDGHDVCRV